LLLFALHQQGTGGTNLFLRSAFSERFCLMHCEFPDTLAGLTILTDLCMRHTCRLSTVSVAAVLYALLLVTGTTASTVINFEDLPDAYFYSSGDENIGTYYSGITFGPDVTALSVSRFGGYDSSGFPPHSGDVAIWDATDATINISFASPITSFGIWYTTFDPLTLAAFDGSSDLLGTVIGDPNTDGTTGTSSFLSFSGTGIEDVTLTSTPGFFVLDDLTIGAGTSAVPEPRSFAVNSISLAVFGAMSLMRSRRRRRP
jgi:hypothetical protein